MNEAPVKPLGKLECIERDLISVRNMLGDLNVYIDKLEVRVCDPTPTAPGIPMGGMATCGEKALPSLESIHDMVMSLENRAMNLRNNLIEIVDKL